MDNAGAELQATNLSIEGQCGPVSLIRPLHKHLSTDSQSHGLSRRLQKERESSDSVSLVQKTKRSCLASQLGAHKFEQRPRPLMQFHSRILQRIRPIASCHSMSHSGRSNKLSISYLLRDPALQLAVAQLSWFCVSGFSTKELQTQSFSGLLSIGTLLEAEVEILHTGDLKMGNVDTHVWSTNPAHQDLPVC